MALTFAYPFLSIPCFVISMLNFPVFVNYVENKVDVNRSLRHSRVGNVVYCAAARLQRARRHSLIPPRAGPTEGFTGTSACAAVTLLNRGSVQYGGRRMEILMTVRKIASICTMVSFSSHKWVISRPLRLTCVWIRLLTGLAQQLTDKQPCHDIAAQPQKVCTPLCPGL